MGLVLALTGSLPVLAATDNPERAALLAEGEAALSHGQVDQALRRFERAAAMAHAADTELALVRTWLQAGQYRQATAFSAHTAGAHQRVVEGAVLYAWLLSIGGQQDAARRLLDQAVERFPAEPMLPATRRLLDDPLAAPAVALPAVRLAPWSTGARVPKGAQVVASGVLIDQGRHALVPLAALEGGARLLVRDGLGRTTGARLLRGDRGLGVALLALQPALTLHSLPVALGDTPVELPLPAAAPRDPFPGSPAHAVEFTPSHRADPAWPRLRSGFHGAPEGVSGERRLGIEMPAGPRGGPVLNAAGQWTGLALPGRGGTDHLVPVSRLRTAFVDMLGAGPGPGAAATSGPVPPQVAVDEVYEGALRMTLQVIRTR